MIRLAPALHRTTLVVALLAACSSHPAAPGPAPFDGAVEDAAATVRGDAAAPIAVDAAPSDAAGADAAAADAPFVSRDAASSCAALDDDFAGTALDPCWKTLNGTAGRPLIDISVAGGALHLTANTQDNGVWYQGSTRSLVYKLVTASRFKLTTTVHPRKASDPSQPPTRALHVGGLMVRDPASNGGRTENYLFIMAGSNEAARPGVEMKSTTDGVSEWDEPAWSTPEVAELRICRLGAAFQLYRRAPGGGTWTLGDPFRRASAGPVSRPDLPETLQVGLALNFSAASDLTVAFDDVSLEVLPPTATVADCTSD
jgi:hypothetical protein